MVDRIDVDVRPRQQCAEQGAVAMSRRNQGGGIALKIRGTGVDACDRQQGGK